MRYALAIVLAAVLLAGCGKGKQEAQERQKRDRQAQDDLMRKQQEEATAMAAQAEQRFAQSQNCHTMIRNRQVLHDAAQRGGSVFGMDGRKLDNPADIRAAFDEAQAYVDQNCVAQVAEMKKGAECSHSPGALVCK